MPLLQLVMSLTKSQFSKMIDEKPELMQMAYCAIMNYGSATWLSFTNLFQILFAQFCLDFHKQKRKKDNGLKYRVAAQLKMRTVVQVCNPSVIDQ